MKRTDSARRSALERRARPVRFSPRRTRGGSRGLGVGIDHATASAQPPAALRSEGVGEGISLAGSRRCGARAPARRRSARFAVASPQLSAITMTWNGPPAVELSKICHVRAITASSSWPGRRRRAPGRGTTREAAARAPTGSVHRSRYPQASTAGAPAREAQVEDRRHGRSRIFAIRQPQNTESFPDVRDSAVSHRAGGDGPAAAKQRQSRGGSALRQRAAKNSAPSGRDRAVAPQACGGRNPGPASREPAAAEGQAPGSTGSLTTASSHQTIRRAQPRRTEGLRPPRRQAQAGSKGGRRSRSQDALSRTLRTAGVGRITVAVGMRGKS